MEMESVTFGYGRENVIENGSVRINKGDFTVISGISGIGKSTFFKLLTGVLTPQKGSISVVSGGKNIILTNICVRCLHMFRRGIC